ncbi:MAG: permease [bacterium]|nr:permease [bacterium]
MSKDLKKFLCLLGIFLFAYFLPLGNPKVTNAILEAFRLLQWYAIHHTLACVVPAMFIAGAIATFLSHASVIRYLGPNASRIIAYTVASVSGIILAVCSCSVLPMFAGIYTMGAGLGPASAFLYSGPAINVMAIFLSARVLGFDLGLARVVGAVAFAFVIGILMALIFRRSEAARTAVIMQLPSPPPSPRRLWQTALFFLALIFVLVFSDWYNTNDVTITTTNGRKFTANVRYSTRDNLDVQTYQPNGKLSPEITRLARQEILSIEPVPSFVMTVHRVKWYLASITLVAVALMLWRWFTRAEIIQWLHATWNFALTILPLLFAGVFITGFVGALVPEHLVARFVGGNAISSNLVASVAGALWYFATLTEIPIVEMLMRLGMGKGPALALLLAGPALSLPSILVIHSVIGFRKTAAFCLLTVVLSALAGLTFGILMQ